MGRPGSSTRPARAFWAVAGEKGIETVIRLSGVSAILFVLAIFFFIFREAGAPAVPPSVAATLDKSYPIARSLHLYTVGEPQGAVKAYIDWILGEAGQRIVAESGYVPVTAAQDAK